MKKEVRGGGYDRSLKKKHLLRRKEKKIEKPSLSKLALRWKGKDRVEKKVEAPSKGRKTGQRGGGVLCYLGDL